LSEAWPSETRQNDHGGNRDIPCSLYTGQQVVFPDVPRKYIPERTKLTKETASYKAKWIRRGRAGKPDPPHRNRRQVFSIKVLVSESLCGAPLEKALLEGSYAWDHQCLIRSRQASRSSRTWYTQKRITSHPSSNNRWFLI